MDGAVEITKGSLIWTIQSHGLDVGVKRVAGPIGQLLTSRTTVGYTTSATPSGEVRGSLDATRPVLASVRFYCWSIAGWPASKLPDRAEYRDVSVSRNQIVLQLVNPEHPASHVDVENCYRLILAREAENQQTVANQTNLPLISIIASFLTSEEFRDKIGLVENALRVSDVMLMRLDSELLEWLVSITGPNGAGDNDTLDRLTVIHRILNDDRITQTLKAFDDQHVDMLKGAFVELDNMVPIVRESALFDQSYYRNQLCAGPRVARPAEHYILLGERLGLKPSSTFDPTAYAELNPDVAASSLNRLFHYEIRGRQEGRAHRDWLADHPMPPLALSSARPTVLLLLHEASYTGAPILGWNLVQALSERCDVVVVLRRGGALEPALREIAPVVVAAPPHEATLDPAEMKRFAERLIAVYKPLYAIANSVESRPAAIALRHHEIPVVALIHEFWPGATPGVRLDFYAACAALVFPARIVEQSSFHAFREIRLQNRFVLPQGACAIPPFDPIFAPRRFGPPFVADDDMPPTLEALLTDGARGSDPFTVIGLGAVEMRKGIDLFISAAVAMKAKYPGIMCRFIWIGTWEHAIGSQYAALIAEQCKRSGLEDRLHFFAAVDNLEPVYDRADALFLSSRLDPLPNTVIDAAFRGIPVVCFDQASGAAELMAANPDTSSLVVPHLDSGAAADRIATLALDTGFRRSCSVAMQQLARRFFDIRAYARSLDEIGHSAARKFQNTEKDRQIIDDADVLDAGIYFGPDRRDMAAETTSTSIYVDETRHLNFASPPVFGVILRRQMAGFHPFIYGTESPEFPRDGSRDPLAHYVEQGMPEGRWTHQILRPDLIMPTGDAPYPVRQSGDGVEHGNGRGQGSDKVALHGHFHYPDTIGDFMIALGANRLRADLFLTTTSVEAAKLLQAATSDYRGGEVVVEVGPNVGRDIYAFLRVLRTHLHGRYELVGHVHGKRSVHAQAGNLDFGERWRRFLWEHLLGPSYGVADVIVAAMQQDRKLGLVFPENGYLVGWEKNTESAASLARRIGLRRDLPPHIEFPAGTMFWARVAALEALVRADFRAEEMPAEPIPIDGTILHAFERMLPLLCAEAGFAYATTYIPHIGR